MEDGIQNIIIYGKVKPKLIADSRGADLFTLILNRKVKPVNRGHAEQAAFLTSKIKELH